MNGQMVVGEREKKRTLGEQNKKHKPKPRTYLVTVG